MKDVVFSRAGLHKDRAWSQFLFQWLALALALHIIAAVRSAGFFHNDEHFQIAEFINAKIGRSPITDLPLEYRELMRPWLFPTILAGFTWLLNSIGITSPFDWALSYRLFAAFVGWLSTVGLALCCNLWFSSKRWRNWAVMALTLLWYVPAFHARPSSESLSGSFFFIGVTFLLLASPPKAKPSSERPDSIPQLVGLIAGFLFGLAFEARYQVIIMIAGALLWLLCIARVRVLSLAPVLLGILIAIGLGTCADFWGYGQWVFAPYRYYQFNIVQTHLSASDLAPWWDYLRRSVTESWPLLGVLLFVSFLIGWLRNPKHILTWSMVPFFVFHHVIHHKELRFLFPLLHAGGVLLLLSLVPFNFSLNWNFRRLQWLAKGLVGFNLIALITLSVIPAWLPIRFYQQLYSFKPYGFELYYKEDVFFNFGGAIMNFYRPNDLQLIHINQYDDFMTTLQSKERTLWLFNPKSQLPEEAQQLRRWCTAEFSTFPTWFDEMKYRNLLDRVSNWTIFRCKSPGRLKSSIVQSET